MAGERLGILFPFLLVWLYFEFGRPSRPLGIPLVISVVLLVGWLLSKDKQWSQQSPWWLVLLAVMGVSIPIATNTYDAFWATRNMAVLFLCICLPLQMLVTSVRRARLWVYSFLAVATYVGGWAVLHGGFGPSAGAGGQDENYIAALMGMAIPFAYFSLFCEKRRIPRMLFVLLIVVFVAAIGLGANASRGGFIGLCVTGLYCAGRSPRKMLGFGILGLMVVALLAIAGPAFWAEIGTTTDYQTGTGDLRLEVWKAGFRMWQANPFLGVGPGNFRWEIGNFQSAEQFAKFDRSLAGSIFAHSLPVELLAELGVAGVIATAMLLWRTWTDLGKVRTVNQSRSRVPVDAEIVQLSCYADAIRASILAILVNGVFLSLLYYSHLWLLIALGSALPFVHRHVQQRRLGGGAAGSFERGPAAPGRGSVRMPLAPSVRSPRLRSDCQQ